MKQMHREDVVESSLFLSDLSGRIFEWPQALRHHEDATMRLLHGQQRAAADECTPHGDQAAQTDGMSCGATDERSRPTLRSWVQPRENAQPSKRISRDIDYIPRNLRRTSSAAAFCVAGNWHVRFDDLTRGSGGSSCRRAQRFQTLLR